MKKTPLRRKKPIRRVSVKQKGRMAKYYKLRNDFMEHADRCWICKRRDATDVHHRKGRRGNLLFDSSWWMAVCRICHDRVHSNPAWAKKMGFLIPFWRD